LKGHRFTSSEGVKLTMIVGLEELRGLDLQHCFQH